MLKDQFIFELFKYFLIVTVYGIIAVAVIGFVYLLWNAIVEDKD